MAWLVGVVVVVVAAGFVLVVLVMLEVLNDLRVDGPNEVAVER